jgi:hypothetical protein
MFEEMASAMNSNRYVRSGPASLFRGADVYSPLASKRIFPRVKPARLAAGAFGCEKSLLLQREKRNAQNSSSDERKTGTPMHRQHRSKTPQARQIQRAFFEVSIPRIDIVLSPLSRIEGTTLSGAA